MFGEFTDSYNDSAMATFFSFPVVMGHEVVAEVSELGPAAQGLEIGQRVILNPWLSCAPRGIDPPCPSCKAGDLSICWHFSEGSLAAGIHTGTCKDAPGGFADYFPAHDSMLIPVPEVIPDEIAVLADRFSVSLHSVTRNPPPSGGRALVYGAGALGTTATAILRALYPDVAVMVVARHPAQAELARSLGAEVVDSEPAETVIEEAAAWSGGVLQPTPYRLPMAHPGGIDVVYDTVGTTETSEVAVRLLRTRGILVKSGVNPPARLGVVDPLLQGDLVGGAERLRRRRGGGRAPACDDALPPAGVRRPDRPLGHAHPYLPPVRVAGRFFRAGHPIRVQRHQGRVRLPLTGGTVRRSAAR